jgi:hypothetical protein
MPLRREKVCEATKFGMNNRLSRHAQDEMLRRGILPGMVDAVLQSPQQVVDLPGGKKAYQSKVDFGRGRIFLVRVIVAHDVQPPLVVTVYRTSKIDKYWRTP